MNKKKMMLGVILLIVVIGYLGMKFLDSMQIITEEIIAEENDTNEVLENTIVEEIAMENTTDIVPEENVENVPQTVENTEEIEQTNAQKNTSKTTTKIATKSQPQEQAKVETQIQPQTEPQITLVAQEIQPEMKATTELQITKKTEETPSTPIQTASNPEKETKDTAQENTYVYNAEMTQRIVDIINSNPSQFMQEYGYNVTIDSSITSPTNQFTFFENRVIEKIQNKAGNIRVYAQDYYYYGECLFTECYII